MIRNAALQRGLGAGFIVLAAAGMFAVEYVVPLERSPPVLHIGMLFLVCYYIRLHYRGNPTFVLSSFYDIYAFLGLLVSAMAISNGAYMLEIDKVGNANGTFWIVTIFFVLGKEAALFGFIGLQRHGSRHYLPRLPDKWSMRLIGIVVGIVMVIAIAILIVFKGPILAGTDRVTFWKSSVPAPLNLFPSLVAQTFFVAAYFYHYRKSNGGSVLAPTLVIVAYITVSVLLLGEKFSVYVIYIYGWLVIKSALTKSTRVSAGDTVKWLLVGLLLLSVIAAFYAMDGKGMSFILVRAALQSQLTWSVLNEEFVRLVSGGEYECYFGCGSHATGADFISSKYLPTSLWEAYSDGGAGLSGFMPALPILLYGIFVALVMHMLISVLFGFIQYRVVHSIRGGNLIYSFLLFKIYLGSTLFWYAAKLSVVPGIVIVIILVAMLHLVAPTSRRNMPA